METETAPNRESTQDHPAWMYDEFKHPGVDYADPQVAKDYDARHGTFRDFEKDAQVVIERLGLLPEHTVADLGCGTGAFVLAAARHCRKVYAVDVSAAMLALCEEKARARGLTNIETHCAGFLTHRHNAEPVDAVVSVAALHHLPDFWKAIAVKRIHEMLKPGGKFYLFDVVFPFSVEEFREQLDGWLQGMQNAGGQAMAYATATHIRDEHSTFDWIMTGMLERAGFHIDRTFSDFPLSSAYVCTR